MTFSDYLLDSVLILLVFRQVRTSRMDRRAVLLPLVIVGFFAHKYLTSLPTAGNDVVLVVIFCAIGLTLGTLSAFATRVWSDGGQHALVKAGAIAAGAWVLGMGFRMGFSIWANNGGGVHALANFSAAHSITSGAAWTDALMLMALFEVCSRTAILWLRSRQAVATYRPELTAVSMAKAA
jgi:hypothetical protein